MERSMVDASSGAALGDMSLVEARNLIVKMASNSQQFSAKNYTIVHVNCKVVVVQAFQSFC